MARTVFAKNFGISLASGLVGWGIGTAIAQIGLGSTMTGFLSASIGGAGAGAAGAALAGGNIGLAALSGLAGGSVGYLGGLKAVGLGNILGGMASSAVSGQEIWEGAVAGITANIGLYMGGKMLPSKSGAELAGNLEAGDILYEKGNIADLFKGLKGIAVALLGDSGPFAHTGMAVSSTEIVDSYPPDGTNIRNIATHPAGSDAQWVRVRTGNPKLALEAVRKALDLTNQGYVFYGYGDRGVFCSQFLGMVYGENSSMKGIKGIGPNTQYFQVRMAGYNVQ